MPTAKNAAVLSDKYEKTADTGRHWDTKLAGFHLVVGKSARSWYIEHRGIRAKLGRFPEVSPSDARQLAKDAMATNADAIELAPTLQEALDDYLDRKLLRSDHNKRAVRSQIENNMRKFLRRRLDTISKMEIRNLFEDLSIERTGKDSLGRKTKLGGTRAANHTLKSFRTVWNHASDKMMEEVLKPCPTKALDFHPEEPAKEIIEDLFEWRAQVDQIDPMHRAIYMLALTTGMRRDECLSLTWDQIEPDRIHLPETKNGRAFDIPLEDRHHDILALCRLGTGEPFHGHWVFPSPKGANYLKAPQKIMVHDRAATLQMHRRTFATCGKDAGLNEYEVGLLLNHTHTSVTSRHYIRTDVETRRPLMQKLLAALPV